MLIAATVQVEGRRHSAVPGAHGRGKQQSQRHRTQWLGHVPVYFRHPRCPDFNNAYKAAPHSHWAMVSRKEVQTLFQTKLYVSQACLF